MTTAYVTWGGFDMMTLQRSALWEGRLGIFIHDRYMAQDGQAFHFPAWFEGLSDCVIFWSVPIIASLGKRQLTEGFQTDMHLRSGLVRSGNDIAPAPYKRTNQCHNC
jgi:hypothetical protein